MSDRISLPKDLREELREAIEDDERSQRSLAKKIGVRSAGLSLFLRSKQQTLSSDSLKELVGLLGLNSDRFFPQLELELDDDLIDDVTTQVRTHLEKLRSESPTLRGTAFHGFIGIRVEGAVEKSFEGVFPLKAS